jgi:RNA polymerase sigma-70 factor (ECF subfamily)
MVTLPTETVCSEFRAVLEHLYLWDRAIKETAAVLGIPVGTVKSRHCNAPRKLRAAFPTETAA